MAPTSEKIDDRWLARDRLVPLDGKVLELALTGIVLDVVRN